MFGTGIASGRLDNQSIISTHSERRCLVEAAIPGCERLGRWSNIVLQNDSGTKECGTPVEASHSKLQSEI
ncbi:hypothetical protein TNCV_3453681 [Trichonephila clavipes]|nr:hypothetical protein TNCV_3453681 [Trichonephila clavipes]